MSKHTFSTIGLCLILGFALMVFSGCDQNRMSSDLDALSDPTLQARMEADPAVQDLYAIFREVGSRYVELDVREEDFVKAYAQNTPEASAELLGYTEAEYDRLDKRFTQAIETVKERYPELSSKELQSQCAITIEPEDIGTTYRKAFASFQSMGVPLGKGNTAYGIAAAEPTCEWVAYTACLVLAATTLTPLLYWVGAYVCLCSFCDHPLCA